MARDYETGGYEVVTATEAHALMMAPIMRAADAQEVHAAAGLDPLAGLRVSLDLSLEAWSYLVTGMPACLFGVSSGSLLSGIGYPWLLSSHLLERHWGPLLRYYRPFLARMLDLFPLLMNWVDARHATALRWLRWMGFAIRPVEPHGPFDLPHHRIELRREER